MHTLSPGQLAAYRAALFANAEGLLIDAALLLKKSRFPRAYSLALLGSEELAKLPLTIALSSRYAAQFLADLPWKELNQGMLDHGLKLSTIGILRDVMEGAIRPPDEINGAGPIDMTPDSFLDSLSTARRANLLKQDGFYVGFDGSHFTTPFDNIAAALARALPAKIDETPHSSVISVEGGEVSGR